MTALGSVVGFAIVFLTVAVGLSALACAAVAAFGSALARRGPAVERRAVELAAMVPVALALLVVVVLVTHSVLTIDHCPAHGHHAHLCIAHGAAWVDQPWAIALASAAAVVAVGRATVLAASIVRGRRRVGALARLARPVGDVQLVESTRAFCFVAGLRRSAIYASTAAWNGLTEDERAAMLAHERGHVRGRDIARRALLELITVTSAPLAPTFLAGRWEHATERLRDADAARVTEPEAVARALIAMCRLGAVRVAGASFEAGSRALALRIESVLAEGPIGEPTARRLAVAAAATVVAIAVATVLLASPVHHALETLFG